MKNRRSPFVNSDATVDLSLQRDQLMSERGILRLKSANRLEPRGQQPEKKQRSENIVARRYARFPSSINIDEVFGTHSRQALPYVMPTLELIEHRPIGKSSAPRE
jgi:hypothetical protein